MAKYVYIAVEVARRELDSRLLLGIEIAARGGTVLLARRADLQEAVPVLPPGVLIDTNLPVQSPDPERRYGLLRERAKRGIANVCMDEEGLVYPGCEMYRAMRTSPETVDLTDLFVVWGNASAQCFADLPSARVLAAGNPRVDLLREPISGLYDLEVGRLRRRYGRYVLFASNFAVANHAGGNAFFSGQTKAYGWNDDDSVGDFLHDRRALVEFEMKKFISALHAAAGAMPDDLQIVVRPHPADDDATWREITAGLPRCHVSKEGAVVPWLLAASALVHSGCTTGLEAHLAGTPAFSLRAMSFPIETPLDLPDAVSRYLPEPADLFADLDRLNAHAEDPFAGPVGEYVVGAPSAARIADAVLALAPRTSASVPRAIARKGWRRQLRLTIGGHPLVHRFRALARRGGGYGASLEARRYYLNKFSSIRAFGVGTKTDRLRSILPGSAGVRLRALGPSAVVLEPAHLPTS
jgi:surface carbohydrate biosynthesis protein